MVNTFRYGLTTIKEDIVGLQHELAGELPQHRQLRRAHRQQRPRHPDAQLRQRSGVGEGRAHVEVRRQRPVQPRRHEQQRQLVPHSQRQRLVGGRRRHHLHARRRLRRVRAVPGGVRRRRVVVRRHVRAAARHHLGDDGVLQLRPRGQRAAGGRARAPALCDRRVRVLRAGQLEDRPDPDLHRRPALQPVLAALRDQRPAGGAGHQAGRLARDPPATDGGRTLQQRGATGELRPGGTEEQQAWLLRLGLQQLRAARRRGVDASGRRWPLRLADRQRQDGHSRRLLDRLRPHRHRAGEQLRQGRLVRHGDEPVESLRRPQRRRPVDSLPGHRRGPADAARGAARRLPADAAVVCRRHHLGARRHHRHAVQPLVQRGRGPRAGQGLLVRGGLCRPARPQPAGAARCRDAGQHHRPGVGARLLHGRWPADSVRAGHPRHGAAVGLRRHSEPARTGRTCFPARPAAG